MGFIVSIFTHLVAMIIARVIFFIVVAFIFLLIATRLSAQTPGDYLYVADLEFDNVGASTSTRMMPVPVNALNYVNSTLIRGDGTDRIFTDANNVEVSGFTQDMTINAANWWVFATSGPTSVVTQRVFHGGADADRGFPYVMNNLNSNDNKTLLRATSSATIEIGDLLDVRVDMQADTPCGWIAGKIANDYEDPIGWALFSIGTLEESPSNGGAGGVLNGDEIFFEITPTNFPIWLCSVGSIKTSSNLVRSAGGEITMRVDDVDTAVQICTSQRVEIVFDISAIAVKDNQLLMPKPCLIERNQHARIFMRQSGNGVWATDDNGLSPVSSTNFTWEINAGCSTGPACDIGGAEPWSRTAVEKMVISYVNASSATSTGDLVGVVDDVWAQSNSNWDGDRETLQLSYTDPTLDVLQNSVVVASVAHAGGIATSTFEMRLGKGFNEGIIHNFEIDAGATTVLDIDFDGDDITESVEGNVANSFLWRGDIQDESGFNNDLEYLLVANMTNINTSVSGFGDNPTPTPVPGISGTSTALTGSPSLNPFFTPVPTPTGGLFMGHLKDAASASTLPTETWWMILGTLILAVGLGFFHKFFPNRPIFAALCVVGMAIISLAVGDDFRMWIVTGFAMWAFGSTALLILWAR